MADVYSWQLGRQMQYRFNQAHPREQFAAVFNINRCIACQTCTKSCKAAWTFSEGQEYMWWNNVETKPYGGYPQNWDVKTLSLLEEADPGRQVWDTSAPDDRTAPYGVYGGSTIFEAAQKLETGQSAVGYIPTDKEWSAPNIFEDTSTAMQPGGATLPEHKTWFFYLQRICNHCEYPACLAACPRNAIYKREEDGIVLIDQKRCRGYRKCVEQCPYKKPMYRGNTRVSEKCIACYPRIEGRDPLSDGVPMETRCMSTCVGKIRLQGLVKLDADGSWSNDPTNPMYYLVRVEKVALPLYPQFGTGPNVYYIPPRWVPRPYLRQMFGPGVDEAIERYTNPTRELTAVLQLFRTQRKIIFRYEIIKGDKIHEIRVNGRTREIFNDTIIGYDKKGREATRIAVMEPFHERDSKHPNSI
jgi:nitrate reductase beta subunit